MHSHPHRLFGMRPGPIFLVSIGLEIGWYALVLRRTYPWRELWASLGVSILRLPAKFLAPLVVTPAALFVWSHRLWTIPGNTAWGLALAFLGEELAYYWSHRAGHEIRWRWASHVVHHTPENIHLATAIRLGATELLSGQWLFRMPLYLLGLNPLAVGSAMAVNLFYQFWLHTDLVGRLGSLEWVLNTPSHHRVHHASNPEYLDRNYGGVLIIWDRIFGTFAAERPDVRIAYGLVHPVGSVNPIRIAFHEWIAMARDCRAARSWMGRMTQLFGRPSNSLACPVDDAALDGAAIAAE